MFFIFLGLGDVIGIFFLGFIFVLMRIFFVLGEIRLILVGLGEEGMMDYDCNFGF